MTGVSAVSAVSVIALVAVLGFQGACVRGDAPRDDSGAAPAADTSRAAASGDTGGTAEPPEVEIVGPPENSPSPTAPRRYSVRVRVPYGLTREQLTAALTRVAEGRQRALDANALMVLAYRPNESVARPYTVGRAVIAPYGDWRKAGQPGPMQVTIELEDRYFKGDPNAATGTERVLLSEGRTQRVFVSRRFESWRGADLVAYVPAGTRVAVLEARTDGPIIRYRVRARHRGRTVEGWVHDENVR